MLEWKRIDNIIKNCKKPISLLLFIIVNHRNIEKSNFSFTLRIYLKYHYKILLNYPVVKLFSSMKLPINPIIIKFYKFYFKLAKSFNTMIKLKNSFRKYKHLSIEEFESKIETDIKIFNSYFDASNSNNNFHSKLMQYFCNSSKNNTIDKEVNKRLIESLKYLGLDFALHFKIPLLQISEFNDLDGIDKFKFINNYFDSVVKTLKTISMNIKKISIYKNILINLSKPKKIKITVISNINSETDIDDTEIFLIK